jgi:hypothetical protein
MRYVITAVAAVLAIVGLLAGPPGVSEAAFHCMRIHAVKAGFAGNPNVQYVELRMDAAGQNFVAGHTIQFLDGGGTLKATFTFPANVTNSATGDSILIATTEFNGYAQGGAADFTFSMANTTASNGGDPLHPVQTPNGKVVFAAGFANCSLTVPVDSVAYGTATADYGTAAVALPSASDNRALRLNNLNLTPMNNSTEYALNAVSNTSSSVAPANLPTDFATPRNNARMVLAMTAPPPPSVGGIAQAPDLAAPARAATAQAGGGGKTLWYATAGAGAALGAALIVLAIRQRRRGAAP